MADIFSIIFCSFYYFVVCVCFQCISILHVCLLALVLKFISCNLAFDLLPIGSYYQSQYPLGYLISLQVNCPFACIYIVVVVVVVVDHCMVVCLKHH